MFKIGEKVLLNPTYPTNVLLISKIININSLHQPVVRVLGGPEYNYCSFEVTCDYRDLVKPPEQRIL